MFKHIRKRALGPLSPGGFSLSPRPPGSAPKPESWIRPWLKPIRYKIAGFFRPPR